MPLDTQVSLGPGDIVLGGDPAPPTKRDTEPFTFRLMSLMAKRSPISATAELLFTVDALRCGAAPHRTSPRVVLHVVNV